ncbi:hypothetical protein AB6T38_06720 [Aliiglaciecola sp. SL4]|uniref:hypothetical protein n=1 Tax=Aliiglaciecola sp. SL4 TaxID=3239806 RepID=UPI00355B65EB
MIDNSPLDYLVSFDRAILETKTSKELLIIERTRYRELFFCKLNSFVFDNKENHDFLFFRSLQRSDYKKYFDSVFNSLDSKRKLMISELYSIERTFNFDTLNYFLQHGDTIKKHSGLSGDIIDSCILLRLVLNLYLVEQLLKLKFKTVVFFSDHQPIEYLFSLVSKNVGKLTITLQHGLYVEYDKIETINRVNYESCVSEYFLAWGENTQKLIRKYHPNKKVLLCGKPNISVNFDKNVCKNKYVTLIFDQPLFSSENDSLLKLVVSFCEQNKLDLNLRCHPGKPFEKYDWTGVENCTVHNNLDITQSLIIIGHTTTMIFEALAVGLPVVQFNSGAPAIHLPQKMQFENFDSMSRAILENKSKSKEHFKAISEKYFAKTGSNSLKTYNDNIKNIFELKKATFVCCRKSVFEIIGVLPFQKRINWLVATVKKRISTNPTIIFVGSEKWLHKSKMLVHKPLENIANCYYFSFKELEKNFNCENLNLLDDFELIKHAGDVLVSDMITDINISNFGNVSKVRTSRRSNLIARVENELIKLNIQEFKRL